MTQGFPPFALPTELYNGFIIVTRSMSPIINTSTCYKISISSLLGHPKYKTKNRPERSGKDSNLRSDFSPTSLAGKHHKPLGHLTLFAGIYRPALSHTKGVSHIKTQICFIYLPKENNMY